MSPLLKVLENQVQLICLAFMALVYTIRVVWIFHFRPSRERSLAEGSAARGAGYALAGVARPGVMESIRRKPFFYAQFVIFHVGVAAAITATFIIPYAPRLFEIRPVVWAFQAVVAAAAAVGVLRLIRRLSDRRLRAVSRPDDYAAVILMILFFSAGVLAVPNRWREGEAPLIAFFALTAFFLVYVPFSKIGHYLYYPFLRYDLGRSLGHRGVLPPARKVRPPAAPSGRAAGRPS
jgi:hypothetical protein